MGGGIFLSIDMDFWDVWDENSWDVRGQAERDLTRICSRLKEWGIPIVAVMNHQQMLPFVSQSDARILVNLDAHSDLCSEPVSELNCGTWVSYVKWRRLGHYQWVTRNDGYGGECDYPPLFHPHPGKGRSHWRSISCRHANGKLPARLLWGVVAAGLCMSPDFSPHEDVFRGILKAYNIPYRKGRRFENYGRTVRSSRREPK